MTVLTIIALIVVAAVVVVLVVVVIIVALVVYSIGAVPIYVSLRCMFSRGNNSSTLRFLNLTLLSFVLDQSMPSVGRRYFLIVSNPIGWSLKMRRAIHGGKYMNQEAWWRATAAATAGTNVHRK